MSLLPSRSSGLQQTHPRGRPLGVPPSLFFTRLPGLEEAKEEEKSIIQKKIEILFELHEK